MDLILLHPLGLSGAFWDPVGERLEPHGRVLAPDLPGFGGSSPLPGGAEHSVPNLAGAVEELMDDSGLDRAHLAGCSMGGGIALELARRGRALTVTAFGPVGGASPAEATFARAHLWITKWVTDRFERHWPRLLARPGVRALAAGSMLGHPRRASARELVRNTRDVVRSSGYHSARRWISGPEGRFEGTAAGLAEIDCPVTIAWGERDRLLSLRQGRRIAGAIPGAELRVMPGLGHLAIIDDPDQVAAPILARAGTGEDPAGR